MCDRNRIKPLYTAVYFQRENPVERKIAELKKTLRTLQYGIFETNRWDEFLPRALRILRSRKNRATGITPSKALLGYEAAKKGQWEIPIYNKQRRERDDAKERRKVIRVRQLEFNEREFPDQHQTPPVTFRRGDKVMVKENNPTGPFAPTWDGPYEISMRWSPQIYEVDKRGKQFRYHVDQLRPAPAGNPETPDDLESDPEDPQDDPHNSDVSYSEDDELPRIVITRAIIHDEPDSQTESGPAGTEVERYVPSPPGKPTADRDESSTITYDKGRNDQIGHQLAVSQPYPPDPSPTTQPTSVITLRRPRHRPAPQLRTGFQGYISTEASAEASVEVRGSDPNKDDPRSP